MELSVHNGRGFELDVPGLRGGVEVAAGHTEGRGQQSANQPQ